MQTMTIGSDGVGRRSFLKGVGAGAVATTMFAGTAAARPQIPPNTPNWTTTYGEGADVVGGAKEDIWTFATTNRTGKPVMLGVWLSEAAFDAVTASPAPSHYHLAFPEVEGLNFTFAGVDWNPMGHPPENV
jgi:hypothetical protein